MDSMKGRHDSGAPGGFWPVSEEIAALNAVRQRTNNCCGPACAEMLFRDRGMGLVSQEWVTEAQGEERSNGESLANAMNEITERLGQKTRGRWKGAFVNTLDRPHDMFRILASHGPFITSMQSFGSDSHMVVIDGLDEHQRLMVRDPYEGTSYRMTWDDFWQAWQGMSVWWVEGDLK